MKRILLAVTLIACVISARAQQNCAQTLRLANSSYDQGRLHELPGLLKGCLNSKGFNKAEEVAAYKLLTLSYIYLEEPEKADSSMISLLRSDNFFEPNQDVDPAEFIGLYNTFRTKPMFTVGLKLGVNISQPALSSNYFVGNGPKAGEYSTNISLQLGLAFEKTLFQNSKSQLLKKFTLAPELLYVTRNYGYTHPSVFLNDSIPTNSEGNQLFAIKQSWLDLNVLLQYQLKPKSKWNPYVTLGPSISYLLSSSLQGPLTRPSGNTSSGPDIVLNTSYNQILLSVVAGVGVKYRLGSIYITGEVRYQYGLGNAIDKSKRTNLELTMDYAGNLPDHSVNNISIMVGGSKPIFKPKKLRKK